MKIGVVLIFLFCIIVAIYPTMSWGGPLSELTNSGEPKIVGIDSIKYEIESRGARSRRPHNVRRAIQARRQRRSPDKKTSLIQKLSDETGKVTTPQREKDFLMGLKPLSSRQFVSAEYLPTSPGTIQTYRTNDSTVSTVKILPETATVMGMKTSVAVNEKTGVSICYTSDNEGILIHRQLFPNVYIQRADSKDLLITFIPPIRLADGLVEVGQTAYSIGTAQYALLPQNWVIDLDYIATYTLQGRKDVVVSAGTFDSLIFEGTLIISGDLESEAVYISKGIGLVKDVVEFAGQKRVTELSFANIVQ